MPKLYRHGCLGQPGECNHAAGVSASARPTKAGDDTRPRNAAIPPPRAGSEHPEEPWDSGRNEREPARNGTADGHHQRFDTGAKELSGNRSDTDAGNIDQQVF